MDVNSIEEMGVLDDMPQEVKRERKYVSSLFFKIVISSVGAYIMVILLTAILQFASDVIYEHSFVSLLLNDLYTVVAIAIFLLISRKQIPQKPVVMEKMTFGKFLAFIIISIFLMISGSAIGNIVSAYLGKITDKDVINYVEQLIMGFPVWQIFIAVVIIAPITEEFLFRKLILTRVTKYGTTFAVLFSGIVFGAFHGNFYQFFYASTIGILLSYIYCVYGKLRFCILIHAIINFVGSVVPLYISDIDLGNQIIPSIVSLIYALLILVSIPAGIILLISYLKRLKIFTVGGILIHPGRTLSKNIGFIIYILVTMISFAISIFV